MILGGEANLAHLDRWREGPSMVLQGMRSSRGISVSLRQRITQSADDPEGPLMTEDQRDGHLFSRHLHGKMTGGPSTP